MSTALGRKMGVNNNTFRRFMDPKTYKDQWSGLQNGTYWAGARLLEEARHDEEKAKKAAEASIGKPFSAADVAETRSIVVKYIYVGHATPGIYPILKKLIMHKIGKKVKIIDSSIAVTEMVKAYLEETPDMEKTLQKNGRSEFFVSDYTIQFEKTATMLLGGNIKLKQAGM